MTDHERAEVQSMLCLAALSYRGFHDVRVGALHVGRMRQALARGFETLSPGNPQYELVWGPIAYRTIFSTFDDAVVYVARRLRGPVQYVIAIRGTNPVSAFDWLFGDFWTSQQIAWPYGTAAHDGRAKISLSTALGLSIVQHMRSPEPAGGVLRDVWDVVATPLGRELRERVAAALVPLPAAVGASVRRAANEAHDLLDALGDAGERFVHPVVDHRLQAMVDAWKDRRRREAVRAVSEALEQAGTAQSPNVLRVLHGGTRLRAALGTGLDLAAFLRVAMRNAGGVVDVVVTGHSKGGALAPTVALWLAETRGTHGVASHEQWDVERRATVRCFAFAGPTAGNAAFAAHADALIGDATYRVHNRLDVVPHAWVPDDLRAIDGIYGAGVQDIDLVNVLVREIADRMEALDYAHVGKHVTELPGTVDRDRRAFFDQVIHQHLDGYLRGLGLAATTDTFFSPLA